MRKPCLTCGLPSEDSRCPEHAPTATELRRTSARERGYDAAWDRLSRKARTLQPWCLDCGATEGLTTDHLVSAWERKAERKPIRLQDVEVVCGPCNNRRGSSRIVDKDLTTRGRDPSKHRRGPEVEAKFASHLPYVIENVAGTERGWRVDLLSDSEPVVGRVGDGDPLLSVEHPQHSTSLNLVGGVSVVTAGMVVALRTQYLKVHPRSLS